MKRPAPRGVLAGLALAVLGAHALLLDIAPATLEPAPPEAVDRPVVFARQLPPASPAAAVPSPAKPAVQPPAKRAKPDLPRTPTPSSEAAEVAEAAEMAAAPSTDSRSEAPETPASSPEVPLAPLTAPIADATAQPGAQPSNEASARPTAPPVIPGSVRLTYDVKGQAKGLNYTASGELVWRRDAGSYEASMVIKAFLIGERSMTSMGDITAQGLSPRRFADKARSERAAHFDPAQGRITFSANTPPAPWQAGAQDRLSVFMQVAGLMAADPARFAPGIKLPIYTASARDADIWTFTVHAPERLDLPLGPIDAIKLTRDARRDFDQQVDVWFAPSLHYLPVRIRLTQHNGDVLDQQLEASSTP